MTIEEGRHCWLCASALGSETLPGGGDYIIVLSIETLHNEIYSSISTPHLALYERIPTKNGF